MSIKSAGEVIREARIRAKLSQEYLSDGICSYVTLCNIEKGTYGVSPLTFELLMEKAGAYREIYPIFENLNDYLCFWNIIHARFYLSRWKHKEASLELDSLKDKTFNENKYYYQEWALLTAWLEVKEGNNNHLDICEFLYQALLLTKPRINLFNIRKIILSNVEIKIIQLYIVECFALGKIEDGLLIFSELCTYMENSKLTEKEKNDIYIKISLLEILKDIFTGKFKEALASVVENIAVSNKSINEKYLFELNYLKAVCEFKLDMKPEFNETISMVHTCEKALDVSFLPFAASFFHSFNIEGFVSEEKEYKKLKLESHPNYKDGTFDIYGNDVMTLGSIIKYHREEQKLSAKTLCAGLCGVALLSKIENNLLNPDIILACTLLNRLGISDEVFTFYGNKEESKFYDLKCTLEAGTHFNTIEYENALLELEKLAESSKKIVIKQTALYYRAKYLHAFDAELFDKLNSILKLTLKDFDINNLGSYKLSKLEFNIINVMMNCLVQMNDPLLAQTFYQQISSYLKNASFDVIQKIQIFPTTNILYFDFLYKYKLYSNIIFEMRLLNQPILAYTLKGMGFVYFYYSMALCEMNDSEKAKDVAQISVASLNFIGYKDTACLLQKNFKDDFNIQI